MTFIKDLSSRFFHSYDNNENCNILRMIVIGMLSTGGLTISSNEIVQIFLLKIGLTKGQIGLFGAAGNISFIVGTLIFMSMADNIRKRIRAAFLSDLSSALIPVVLFIFSIFAVEKLRTSTVLGILLIVCIMQYFIRSLSNLFSFILPMRLVRIEIIGRFSSVQAVMASIAAIIAGFASVKLLSALKYQNGFTVCFTIAVILLLSGSATYLKLAERGSNIIGERGSATNLLSVSTIISILKTKEFRILALPNILRGAVGGVSYFIMAFGISRFNLPVIYAAYIVTLNTIATLGGYVFFGLLDRKVSSGKICFAGSTFAAASLAALVFSYGKVPFLLFNTLFTLGLSVLAMAVPVGIFKTVEANVIGAFTGTRFLLMQSGTAVSTLFSGWILDNFNPAPLFFAAAVIQFICGTLFMFGFRILKEGND